MARSRSGRSRRDRPDGDGSLLDHSLMLYGCRMSDSNLHLPENLPTLVVGGKAHGVTPTLRSKC